MKEWDYEKNNGINPADITIGSNKKVWWKCEICGKSWQATVHNRNKGTGCPVCGLTKIGATRTKNRIKKDGCLADSNPKLAEEWNYEKNKSLKPSDVHCRMDKKVWWKCKNCGSSWQASIYNRAVLGSGCIYCTQQKAIKGVNDFKTLYPELVKEWDYEKNDYLLPETFLPGSNIKVWWKCQLGHSWKTSINHRTNGTNCPKCYGENGTSFAEQAIYYYLSKKLKVENRIKIDDQEIDIYLPDLKIGFEYDGVYYHSSLKSIEKEKLKNIILKDKDIYLYRIKESNRFDMDSSNNIIYCIPDRNYNYIEKVLKYIQNILNIDFGEIDINKNRTNIYNNYIKNIKNNSIANNRKDLVKEWDYIRNGDLKPENFTIGSNVKVWWICNLCGSSYLCSIVHKVEGNGCPFCNGKKVNETNCLSNKFPDLLKTWDYIKNDNLSPDSIYYRSRKKVWWKCPKCNKSFIAPICSRIRAKEYDCPECMHKRIGKKNHMKYLKDKKE